MTSQVTYVSSVEDRCKRSKLNNVIQSLHCYISNSTPDVACQDFGLIDYCGPICKGQLIKGNQPAKRAGTPVTAMGVYLGDINKDGILQVTNTQSLNWSQSAPPPQIDVCSYWNYSLCFCTNATGSSCYCEHDNGLVDCNYTCERSCCICPGCGYICPGCCCPECCRPYTVCYVCIKEVWVCTYTKDVLDCCVFCDVFRGNPYIECGGYVTDSLHQVSLGRNQYLAPGMYVSCWPYDGLDKALYDSGYYKLDGSVNECCIAAGILPPEFSVPSQRAACGIIAGLGWYSVLVGPEIMCAFASVSLDNNCPVVNEWLWCDGQLCYHQKCTFGLQWYYSRYFSDMESGSAYGLGMTVDHLNDNMIRNIATLEATKGPFLCDQCIANGRWQFRCSPDDIKTTYTNTIPAWSSWGGCDCCKNVWGYMKAGYFGPAATSAIFGEEQYPSSFCAFGDFYFCRPSDTVANATKSCLCDSTTGNISLCLCSTHYCIITCTKITCICTCFWDFSKNICINERYY